MKKKLIWSAVIGLAVAAAAPALAAAPYNATIAGQPGSGRSPLVNLVQSSTQTIDVTNLPANVGLYALHCVLPSDPRQAPTQCDDSATGLAYLTATPADRATVQIPIKVNAEFYGTNPNPTMPGGAPGPVNCRMSACAVYVLGAGKESANPQYIRVWPTQFTPVTTTRKADAATVSIGASTISPANAGTKPTISTKPVKFSVTLASGLTPTLSSQDCTLGSGTIAAISTSGTCTVQITSTGGKYFLPIVTTQVIKIDTKATV
ncbi:MAG: hypothetical protein ORN20_03520 [Candidatus Nanopelagicales bacterium]|jgi:hypothetical protein|nr:hypothetical protein [Candidatus Nanopelagicales bacterium]